MNWLDRWRSRRIARHQEAAYRRLWQAFSRYPTLADGRHDDDTWRAHNGRFAACLIRVPAARLAPELEHLRQAIAQPGQVRLHPDHFLHVMVQEIGFVTRNPTRSDEISLERFDELCAALSTALNDIRHFEAVVANANSFEDAAFLELHDGGRIEAVHARLREVAAVPIIPRYAFLPHITVAHYLGEFDSLPMVKALQQFRGTRFGTFPVMEIEIVTMRVDIDYPQIYTIRKLPLKQ